MDRITRSDLDNMLTRYSNALVRLDMHPANTAEGGRLGMNIGSKTYGIAYRLFVTDYRLPDGTTCTGHARPPVGPEYLGMTAREAFETLATMASTAEDIARHQGR